MHPPGFYRVDYRALRLRELVRMGGLFMLPFSYFAVRRWRASHPVWMPGSRAESECEREDLSDGFWDATAHYRQEFQRLGFAECGFTKATKNLNPNSRDNGGIVYLDSRTGHVGLLLYTRIYARPPIDRDVTTIAVSFTAAFARGTLSYTNNQSAFDPAPHDQVVRLSSPEPAPMYQRMLRHLSQIAEVPRSFPDMEAFWRWSDQRQRESFEWQVQRGLFVRLSDEEVAAARRKLPAKP